MIERRRGKMGMEKDLTLAELACGESGKLLALEQGHPLTAQLYELGWYCGCEIQCVRRLGKAGPYVFRTAGGTVALRGEDAARIRIVRSTKEESHDGG
jgi:Fe2+ transport system protein FeoA